MALAICCNRRRYLRRVLRRLVPEDGGPECGPSDPVATLAVARFERAVPKVPLRLPYSGRHIRESVNDLAGHRFLPKAQQHFRSDSENSQVHRERKQAWRGRTALKQPPKSISRADHFSATQDRLVFALSSRTNGESKLDCGEGFRDGFSCEILC